MPVGYLTMVLILNYTGLGGCRSESALYADVDRLSPARMAF